MMRLITRPAAFGLALAMSFSICRAETASPLSDLPEYKPGQTVSGTLRIFGSKLSGTVSAWEKEFARFHPAVHFEDRLPSSDAWTAGLESGVADIATSGREPGLTEYLSFSETFGYMPTEISVATGSYDIKGKTWALIIYVNENNPITKLTMKQLDGIFGSERSGALTGIKWNPELARGPEGNIRTWDQLGLHGEWAGKPIQTYGYCETGMRHFFELKVFQGGDKWNPNYLEYAEYGTPMIGSGPQGPTGSSRIMLEHLAHDKYGIAFSGIEHAKGISGLRAIALQAEDGGPYVMPSRETVQDRSYPLSRSIFFYLNREPGKPLDPLQKEFLRYVLSRNGQAVVEQMHLYLPLTRKVLEEQLKKLD